MDRKDLKSSMHNFISAFNNISNNKLWKRGLLHMYHLWKPIDSYDHRHEPSFVTFQSRDAELSVIAYRFIELL